MTYIFRPILLCLNYLSDLLFNRFEGDGMLHAIKLDNGKVVGYNNHFVRTDAFKAEEHWQKPVALKARLIKYCKRSFFSQ